MPGITSLSITAASPLARGILVLSAAAVRRLKQLARALRNRHVAGTLARFDDRMLRDIGITRSDLRDAYSEPLWQDPTDVLAQRATERRGSRRHNAFECSSDATPHRPSADRPSQYLI